MKSSSCYFYIRLLVFLAALIFVGCSAKSYSSTDEDTERTDSIESDNYSDDSDEEPEIIYPDEEPGFDPLTEPVMISQKDINPYHMGSFSPCNFKELPNGTTVFSGYSAHGGEELWKTDGTVDGTELVKDILPGSSYNHVGGFVGAGDQVLFSVFVFSEIKTILYKTDGTTEGTVPVKTEEGLFISDSLIMRDELYQRHYDPWYSINTIVDSNIYFFVTEVSGNKRLVVLNNGSDVARTLRIFPGASAITGISGESIFFVAKDESGRWKLMKYNTKNDLFSDIHEFECENCVVNVTHTHQFSTKFIFGATLSGQEFKGHSVKRIYFSDGTPDGTFTIEGKNSPIRKIDSLSETAYVLLSDNSFISTDGTAENTFTFETGIDFEYSYFPYGIITFKLIEEKYLLLYTLKNYIEKDTLYSIPQLTTFDLDSGDLNLFHSFDSLEDNSFSKKPVVLKYNDEWYIIDGEVYNEWSDGFKTYSDYLYKVDFRKGTKTKIDSLVNFANSSFREYARCVSVKSGKILMGGQFLKTFPGNIKYVTGYEMVVSDGTVEGTGMLKQIGKASRSSGYSKFYPVAHKSYVFYNEPEDVFRERINFLDVSSQEGTKTVNYSNRSGEAGEAVSYGDFLLFNIYPKSHISNVSRVFGSFDLTKNSITHLHENYVARKTALESGVLYLGRDSSSKNALYVTDGTKEGTKIIKEENILAERVSSNEKLHSLLLSNGKIALFMYLGGSSANDDLNYQLWKTDGTESGTVKLLGGIDKSFSRTFKSLICGEKFIISSSSSRSYQVYLSGGTPDSSYIVADCNFAESCTMIHPGCSKDIPLLIKEDSSELGISIHKISSSGKLEKAFFEKSDVNLKRNHEIFNTPGNSNFFFVLNTKDHGYELWRTDGTAEGTSMVKDIYPGLQSSYPAFLAYNSPYLYFNASNGINGYELWRSDGTAENTEMFIDLNPGPGSSTIQEAVIVDTGIIVNGAGSNGLHQLWFVPF